MQLIIFLPACLRPPFIAIYILQYFLPVASIRTLSAARIPASPLVRIIFLLHLGERPNFRRGLTLEELLILYPRLPIPVRRVRNTGIVVEEIAIVVTFTELGVLLGT